MPQSIVQYDKELPYIDGRNPWEVPVSFLKKKAENEYELIQGRRPSKMICVNKLRSEIDKWRNDGYPGATATTPSRKTLDRRRKNYRWNSYHN